MQFISFKSVPLLVAVFLHAVQTVNAQGTCICEGGEVTGTGTDLGTALADAVSMCTETNNCDMGFTCPSTVCNTLTSLTVVGSGGTATATGTCSGSVDCVMASTGTGDPHLTGFDGSKFDFHGEHGKRYIVYGRPAGDMLVTQMRESQLQSTDHPSRPNPTFFDEFGLQIANSRHKIRIFTAKDSLAGGRWLPKVEVNGQVIKENLNQESCRISFRPGEKWVSIITKETDFMITVRRPEDERDHHLNIFMQLKGFPSYTERYLGILGVTINRALGHDLHPDLDVSGRAATLETGLRNRFEVESLFPRYDEGQHLMRSGGIRSISDVKHVEKVWTAETA